MLGAYAWCVLRVFCLSDCARVVRVCKLHFHAMAAVPQSILHLVGRFSGADSDHMTLRRDALKLMGFGAHAKGGSAGWRVRSMALRAALAGLIDVALPVMCLRIVDDMRKSFRCNTKASWCGHLVLLLALLGAARTDVARAFQPAGRVRDVPRLLDAARIVAERFVALDVGAAGLGTPASRGRDAGSPSDRAGTASSTTSPPSSGGAPRAPGSPSSPLPRPGWSPRRCSSEGARAAYTPPGVDDNDCDSADDAANFDPYEVLGVDIGASPMSVRSIVKRQLLRSHPDKGGSARRFRRVKRAIDMLRSLAPDPPASSAGVAAAPPPPARTSGGCASAASPPSSGGVCPSATSHRACGASGSFATVLGATIPGSSQVIVPPSDDDTAWAPTTPLATESGAHVFGPATPDSIDRMLARMLDAIDREFGL